MRPRTMKRVLANRFDIGTRQRAKPASERHLVPFDHQHALLRWPHLDLQRMSLWQLH
jgi:hypothetical protein